MEPMLSMEDFAEMIGVSRKTIQRYRAAGELPPSFKFGKQSVRFKRRDVEAWVERRRERGR